MRCNGICRRIFVVGVPRSGTTLVQSLLAAHSRVRSFTESHFFSRHFALLPFSSRAILSRNPAPRLRDFLVENGVESPDSVSSDVPRSYFLPFSTRAVAQQFLQILDELTLLESKSVWVEKTPRHLRYIPFLEGLSGPDQRPHFVHVIREGLDTVASLHAASKNWEYSYTVEGCIRRWNADVGFSLTRVASRTDHFVFYEELTAHPEITLRRLFADLELDWEPEIFERYGGSSRRLITEEETWKVNVDRDMERSSTSDRVLTDAQRSRATAVLNHALYTQLRERSA